MYSKFVYCVALTKRVIVFYSILIYKVNHKFLFLLWIALKNLQTVTKIFGFCYC